MPFYITENSKGNPLPVVEKARSLQIDGATVIKEPEHWIKNLVCVTSRKFYDSAIYVENQAKLNHVLELNCGKTWLIYEHAKTLAKEI